MSDVKFAGFPQLPEVKNEQAVVIFKSAYTSFAEHVVANQIISWLATPTDTHRPQWSQFKLEEVLTAMDDVTAFEIARAVHRLVTDDHLIATLNETGELIFEPTLLFAENILKGSLVLVCNKPIRRRR